MTIMAKQQQPTFSAIVALTPENGMGKDGKIPWRVPEDFKYFKQFTMGKTCVMGRKTYEDILTYAKDKDDPLPGRQLVVLSSTYTDPGDPSWGVKLEPIKGIRKICNMAQLFGTMGPICFIGGANIYKQAAKRYRNIQLSVTRLNFPTVVECDTFFDPIESGFIFIAQKPLEGTAHTIEYYLSKWTQ